MTFQSLIQAHQGKTANTQNAEKSKRRFRKGAAEDAKNHLWQRASGSSCKRCFRQWGTGEVRQIHACITVGMSRVTFLFGLPGLTTVSP
jgi:hypothetical protein